MRKEAKRRPSIMIGIFCICLALLGGIWLEKNISVGNVWMIVVSAIVVIVAILGIIYHFKNIRFGNGYVKNKVTFFGDAKEKNDPWKEHYGVQNGGDVWDQMTKSKEAK